MVRELTTAEVEAMLEVKEIEDIKDGRIVVNEHQGGFMATQRVTEPDEALLYDRRTGTPTVVRLYDGNNTLQKMLEKTDPLTGLRVFTTSAPEDRPELFRMVVEAPHLACWFNETHEEIDYYRSIVGSTSRCGKATLDTPESVRAHVQNKHPRWYSMVQEHEERVRYEEQRDQANRQLEAILAVANQNNAAGAPVAAPPAAAPAAPVQPPRTVGDPIPCEEEGCDYVALHEHGMLVHRGKVHKE